ACCAPDHCGAATRQTCSPISLLAMALIEATIFQIALVVCSTDFRWVLLCKPKPACRRYGQYWRIYCPIKRDRACGHFNVTKMLRRLASPFRGLLRTGCVALWTLTPTRSSCKQCKVGSRSHAKRRPHTRD